MFLSWWLQLYLLNIILIHRLYDVLSFLFNSRASLCCGHKGTDKFSHGKLSIFGKWVKIHHTTVFKFVCWVYPYFQSESLSNVSHIHPCFRCQSQLWVWIFLRRQLSTAVVGKNSKQNWKSNVDDEMH